MKYYQVLAQYDQCYKCQKAHNSDIYIVGELYTEREVEKNNLNKNYMQEINLSPKKVYNFFGARFRADPE